MIVNANAVAVILSKMVRALGAASNEVHGGEDVTIRLRPTVAACTTREVVRKAGIH